MHARLAATLICLCVSAMPTLAGSTPPDPRDSAPTRAALTPARETREARDPSIRLTGQSTPDTQAPRQTPPPPPADAAPSDRGLMLAGIALMVGIALRRLGSGAP